jgi:hypothetical protein
MLCIGNYWDSATNRRAFFEQFAVFNGFDPLIAENWYKISKNMICEAKVSLLYSTVTV